MPECQVCVSIVQNCYLGHPCGDCSGSYLNQEMAKGKWPILIIDQLKVAFNGPFGLSKSVIATARHGLTLCRFEESVDT